MIMRYKLTPRARKDLKEIWNYTIDKWGEKQAKTYLNDIFECFDEITNENLIYKRLLIGNKNFKLVRCGHHCIFFTVDIEPTIAAILHEKMDFVLVLKKRLFA